MNCMCWYLIVIPMIFAWNCEQICRITIGVKENTPLNELQWNLRDYESNSSINWHYSLSNPSEFFEIQSNYLKYRGKDFDREKLCPHVEPCTFDLQIFTQYSLIILFHLIILDENDCQPRFEQESLELLIRENLSMNYRIQLPIAHDDDSKEFNIDRYEFIDDNQRMFVLEKFHEELKLKLIQPFDCEQTRFYHLKIIAIDKGGWKSNVLYVNITVGDVNEYQPKFSQRFYHTRIPENLLRMNSTSSSSSILQVHAIDDDCDDDLLEYSIINHEIPHDLFPFSIDRLTGSIYVRGILDYELISIYRFRVRASNFDRITSSIVRVIIDILDINDNPPLIHVNILQEYFNGKHIQIHENISHGQVIGTVMIRDMDSILTNDQLSLEIQSCSTPCPIELDTDMLSSTMSLIRIGRNIDSESFDRIFTVILQARDYGQPSLTSEYQLNIEVIDVNDCAPKFRQKNYQFRVMNDTPIETFLGEIQAIDDDSSPEYRRIRYQFLDDDQGENDEIISIDSNNGSLVLHRFPSNEIRWNRIVQAIDQQNQSLFDQANIEIIFEYQKPCVWQFNDDIYIFNTTEHQQIPYEIGQVNVTNCLALITYDLISDDSLFLPFSIDKFTGKIYVIKELDREIIDFYELFVQVFNDESHQFLQTKIHIHILDENDHRPIFTSSLEQYIYISLSSSQLFITNIHANDADLGMNSFIDYYFLDQHFYAYFRLFSNGSIILFNPLHLHLPVRLRIIARDRGVPHALNSTEIVLIHLCDISQWHQCFQRKFHFVFTFIIVVIIGFSLLFIMGILWRRCFHQQLKRRSTENLSSVHLQ